MYTNYYLLPVVRLHCTDSSLVPRVECSGAITGSAFERWNPSCFDIEYLAPTTQDIAVRTNTALVARTTRTKCERLVTWYVPYVLLIPGINNCLYNSRCFEVRQTQQHACGICTQQPLLPSFCAPAS